MATYIVVPKRYFTRGLAALADTPEQLSSAQAVIAEQLFAGTTMAGQNVLTAEGLRAPDGGLAEGDLGRAAEAARAERNPRVLESLGVLLVDDLTDKDRAELSDRADVLENIEIELIEPDKKTEGAEAEATEDTTWHLDNVNVGAARDQGLTGRGVRIGIMDTGIDPNHGEFAGKDISFMEFDDTGFPSSTVAQDFGDHGTHVAGIAAGTTRGVAPDADLAVAAVLTRATARGMSGTLAQILGGYNWLAHTNHATGGGISKCPVINASLGGVGYRDYLYASTEVLLTLNTAILIAAIGNAGRNGADNHGSPGNYDIVLGIGATDRSGIVAPFSDWGFEPTNAVYKPDMCAPGVDINSSVPNGGYARMSGTSMATPMVSGATALVLQKHQRLSRRPVALQRFLLTLIDSSQNNDPANKDTANPSYSRIGAGRLDLTRI